MDRQNLVHLYQEIYSARQLAMQVLIRFYLTVTKYALNTPRQDRVSRKYSIWHLTKA